MLENDDDVCGCWSADELSVSLSSDFVIERGAAAGDIDGDFIFLSFMMVSFLLLFGEVRGDGGSLVETTSMVSASSSSSSPLKWRCSG